MVATLVAFFALGFFSATLFPLFQFLAVVLSAALVVMVVAIVQGMTLIGGLGLGIADLALAQVGYGLGLAWVASSRSRCARD
ncbi:hypothetical protein [Lichenifustis flavocetrariae]|uniref:Uncharacterized protein n=1 Tax=Lichenifustis flavocetrariae TaxID=2949735 RepID=A0AA41Z2A3_9HYPH|nr:hypothetical protein [Lichenifustis flavocetrariae]MCW6509040.1 hypothetical protein [Lichenifustis flavocetrariae]